MNFPRRYLLRAVFAIDRASLSVAEWCIWVAGRLQGYTASTWADFRRGIY